MRRRWLLYVIATAAFAAAVLAMILRALGLQFVAAQVLLVAAALTAAAVLVFVLAEGRQRTRAISDAEEDPKEVLRRRVERVNRAVAAAASEMQELQRDLEAQQAASAALLSQAEEQQRLLEINQEQAEKIRHILVGETKATLRAEGRKQWMFFGLGVLVSIPIGVMINIFVP
ncbi:hypothetical protein [Nonomuraea fuscirosea]|uniref:hypothetical protein n=1 Tax=Nonomuraea fuscirosea TaxID=1291556 RepID=UPI0033DC4E49